MNIINPGSLKRRLAWRNEFHEEVDGYPDFTHPISPAHPVLGLLAVVTISRPMSWVLSWTECTRDAGPVLMSLRAKAGSILMTLAVGGGGGCCGCHLVGGVLERQVGSFTRWKFVKAFGAWELFVSWSCKLSDASAQTQADSPAHGSAQVQPLGVPPLRPGLSPRLALRVLSGREQARTLLGHQESGDQVKGGQLWAGLAADSRVQGSERQPEGPAGNGSVSSAPRAPTTCCWPCRH